MFNKKKKPETDRQENTTPNSAAEEQPKEFQKNIKTLWIYTSLFCVFALALIFISSFFQEKRDKENESLRVQVEKHELVLDDKQDKITNIENEIETYKQINEILNQRNEYLEGQAKIDKDLMSSATLLLENADYLMMVEYCISVGDLEGARVNLAAVDSSALSENMRLVYDKYVLELATE